MNFIDIKELLTILVVFSANIVETITGFAGTMLAMPAAMQLIGVMDAKIVLNVVALFVSSTIWMQSRKDTNLKEVYKISGLMVIGMAVGLYLFNLLPVDWLSRLYGILIILVAIKGLFVKKQFSLPEWMLLVVVLAAGVIHGMFLSGGSLLVIYAITVLKDKSVIRATLAPVWIFLNLIILAQDIWAGHVTSHCLVLAVCCLPPVCLALYIGNLLHKRIPQDFFVKLTYLLLILSGASLFM